MGENESNASQLVVELGQTSLYDRPVPTIDHSTTLNVGKPSTRCMPTCNQAKKEDPRQLARHGTHREQAAVKRPRVVASVTYGTQEGTYLRLPLIQHACAGPAPVRVVG